MLSIVTFSMILSQAVAHPIIGQTCTFLIHMLMDSLTCRDNNALEEVLQFCTVLQIDLQTDMQDAYKVKVDFTCLESFERMTSVQPVWLCVVPPCKSNMS